LPAVGAHFVRLDRDTPERGPHGDPILAWASVQHRTVWEPPEVRTVRAVWTSSGGRCYSLASASVEPLLMHPLSSSRTLSCPKPCLTARRRLSTSWMRTLRMPRLGSTGRAFTRCVPTSDVPCRPWAPAHRLLRAQAPAPCVTLERPRSVLPRDQNRSTVPSPVRSHLLVARRWRNDSRRLPSYRSTCLPPQTRAHFSHTGPMPHGAGQDQTSCLPCEVLAWRLRTVSLGRRGWPDIFAAKPRARGGRLGRPSLPSRCGDRPRRPRQRIRRFAMG